MIQLSMSARNIWCGHDNVVIPDVSKKHLVWDDNVVIPNVSKKHLVWDDNVVIPDEGGFNIREDKFNFNLYL